MPYNDFPNQPSWNNCSVFNMPIPTYNLFYNPCFGGGYMMPFASGFMMPFGGFWGGCCRNKFFDMIMSMQLFQMMMNSFTNLSNNIPRPNHSSHRPNNPPNSYSFTPSIVNDPVRVETPSYNYNSNRTYNINTNTNLPQLRDIGYNPEKGTKLVHAALSNATGFSGFCAKYVRFALEESGLSNGMKADAAEYDTVLDNNPNFKQISTQGLDLRSLPAGCILVYERGQSGYSSKYGHVEITIGNGQAVSDGITNNIRPGAKVYVPV